MQERLAALSAQPQGDAAAQQRWEWAWALGNLVAQRRSGVLPAPGALDARLPELLEVFAEPRAVLEDDSFSALIEEIDLWASGLEAPPAILPAPPTPQLPSPWPCPPPLRTGSVAEGIVPACSELEWRRPTAGSPANSCHRP